MTPESVEQQQALFAIQNQQRTLLLQMESSEGVDLEQVQTFLHALAQAGTILEDVEDRSLVHGLIRYWSSFVDEKTGAFPIIQLQPFDSSLRAPVQMMLSDRPAFLGSLPPIWNIPYPRNAFFLGRTTLLSQLAHALNAGQTVTHSQPQAISGLGGIGKTQIALEFAYQYRQNYQAVLWVQADTYEMLISSIVEIAGLLSLPEKGKQELSKVITAVKDWLQINTNWLLILDNADNIKVALDFLPSSVSGHVLITTRAQVTGRFARRFEVTPLSTEEGALLLLRRAGVLASDGAFEHAPSDERVLASEICEELGGLPLALDQAGAYIEETGRSLAGYQHLYQTRRRELLQRRGDFVNDHPEPVATTWLLSFAQVEQRSLAAADLLRVCAFLAPDAIPEELLIEGAKELGDVLAPVAADPYLLDQAITVLRAYSLIARDLQTQILTIHRLVQVVVRDSMSSETQRQWMQRVIQAVEMGCLEGLDVVNWPLLERLMPHMRMCVIWIERVPFTTPAAARLLNQAGYYLNARGRYREAEPLFMRALEIREQELGQKHPDTATSLNNLAELYQMQGKYALAEPLLVRALAIYEELLESEHPDMTGSMINLAELYKAQGKYALAEPLLVRALVSYEELLGSGHPLTATSLNNLGALYQAQGNYAEAEPLYLRALEICEQELGPTHPDTAGSLNNLAGLYYAQGNYAEAEPLYLRALEIDREAYGDDHPGMAMGMNNLGALYQAQGNYAEAEPLYLRALAIREKLLGPRNPLTATSLNNLGMLYDAQEKYEEAEQLLVRALFIREQEMGPGHPLTVMGVNNLAGLYEEQGKYALAEPLWVRALTLYEESLDSRHPEMATGLNNLAELYQAQGKYAEAEPLLARALEIVQQSLGVANSLTKVIQSNYTSLLRILEQEEQAVVLETEGK